jgi:hypothetical protein
MPNKNLPRTTYGTSSSDPSTPLTQKSGKIVAEAEMPSDPDRSTLRDMLVSRSLKLGKVFRLSSGASSDRYMDAKLTTLSSAAMPLIGHLFNRAIEKMVGRQKLSGD